MLFCVSLFTAKSVHVMDAKQFAQLDLNLLRVVVEIYQQGQLALAADKLAVSPSAVSHALRRLRDQLGDPLFLRQGRQLVPTSLCSQLAPQIEQYLKSIEQALLTPQQFNPLNANRVFNLAMPDALESSLLPGLFRRFATQAPACTLRSIPLSRQQLTAMLTVRDIDIAVDVALPVSTPVIHTPLFTDKFIVLSRAPLNLQTMLAYLSFQHITVSGRAKGIVLEDLQLLSQGIERRISMRCQGYQSAAQIVAGSDLVLTVPRMIGQRLAQQFGLHHAQLPLAGMDISLRCYWHQQQHSDSANQWLRELLASEVANVVG